jgi:peptide/nickel transport system permease protein
VGTFLLRRLVRAVVVTVLAASATFALMLAAPGDPMAAILDATSVDEATRDQWRAQWALDRSGPERYVAWISSVARGQLGPSVALGMPIARAIGDALPYTVLLMGTAILCAIVIGVGLAVLQARHARRPLDRTLDTIMVGAVAAPEAGIAFLLIGVVAVSWGLLPAGGAHHIDAARWSLGWRVADLLAHLVLPAATLTLAGAAVIARHQRSALLAVLPEDFVTQWRARGLPERRLWWRVILRHAAAPVITLLGLALPALVGGAVIVERIFAWPGMGTLVATGVARRDAPLVATCVAVTALCVVLGSTLADLMHRALDPRLRDADHR